jgi:hypothetical protein
MSVGSPRQHPPMIIAPHAPDSRASLAVSPAPQACDARGPASSSWPTTPSRAVLSATGTSLAARVQCEHLRERAAGPTSPTVEGHSHGADRAVMPMTVQYNQPPDMGGHRPPITLAIPRGERPAHVGRPAVTM